MRVIRKTRHAGGFTLIEMMAAAGIVVAMMVGIVAVFRMATDAVLETNDKHEVYQRARGIFSALARDIACLSTDGYLRIATKLQSGKAGEGTYDADLLVFTTTGVFPSVNLDDMPPNTPPAPAAEVVYTSYVNSPDSLLTYPWDDGQKHTIRKGILARAVYGVHPDPEVQAGRGDLRLGDLSKARIIRDFMDAGKQCGASCAYIWPYSIEWWNEYACEHPEFLARVLATHVGEFKVEYTLDGDTWRHGGKTFHYFSGDWPLAIRVTLVIFGLNDRLPPDQSPNFDGTKFQGFVFQQAFWLPRPPR